MKFVLVLLLSVEFVLATQNCSDFCSFIYHNPTPDTTSIDLTSFKVTTNTGSVTGIVTVDFDFFSPEFNKDFDNLRFRKNTTVDDFNDQPLVFKFYRDNANKNIDIFGRTGGDIVGGVNYLVGLPLNVQISDIASDNYYMIYFGVPGSALALPYNYGSTNNWETFNERLNSTLIISNDGRCTVYNFISACSTPTPQLCDTSNTETIIANIGTSYTLQCSASGAPYLTSNWTNDTFKHTTETALEVYDNTTADNYIVSTTEINSFTVDHIGTWTCTISNKNFGDAVTKVYTLEYSADVSVVSSPSDWYVANEGDASFVWEVQGWPIDSVILVCGSGDIITAPAWYSGNTPQVSLTLTLSDGTIDNQINCTLHNDESHLATINITRVGYNCKEGEKGVKKSCEVCPKGETSLDGSDNCFAVSSQCLSGEYGVDSNCTECPEGEISDQETVKIQDCLNVISKCEAGTFGHVDSTCELCPDNETSPDSAVKLQECYPANSSCEAGSWGAGEDCLPCPSGKTSSRNTLKQQDCVDKPASIGAIIGYICAALVAAVVVVLGVLKYRGVFFCVRRTESNKDDNVSPTFDNIAPQNTIMANPRPASTRRKPDNTASIRRQPDNTASIRRQPDDKVASIRRQNGTKPAPTAIGIPKEPMENPGPRKGYGRLNLGKFKKPAEAAAASSDGGGAPPTDPIYSNIENTGGQAEPQGEPIYADQFTIPEEDPTYASVEFVNEARRRDAAEDARRRDAAEDAYASVEIMNRDRLRKSSSVPQDSTAPPEREVVYSTLNGQDKSNSNAVYATMRL